MKQLTCEMCGSTELIKDGGFFICQTCGTKYSVEEAKKMMIEGTVDVQGTVKVDNSSIVQKYLINAHRALAKEDWEEVEKYYNLVEQNSPDNIEAVFFSSYGRAMLSMTDSEYFKREQKFKVLNKSMSIISDCYDTTTENKEESLKKIATYIKKMYNVTFTYQRQSIDLNGALRSMSAVTGTRKWCINLIDETKQTFVKELREIAANHNEPFIMDIIRDLDPTTTEINQKPQQKKAPYYKDPSYIKKTGIVFGILGIILAWLFALSGHILSICAIIQGVRLNKKTSEKSVLILGIIGEICAITNSILGVLLMIM